MRAAGWSVDARPTEDMAAMKDRLGVPAEARSCHTSTVAGYVVEGHVPLAAIERLLAERPAIRGIALPGMEPGSPGMDGAGDAFEVVSIGADGSVGAFGTFPA
jgi:hypothetical protein